MYAQTTYRNEAEEISRHEWIMHINLRPFSDDFWTNPQYLLSYDQSMIKGKRMVHICVALMQKDTADSTTQLGKELPDPMKIGLTLFRVRSPCPVAHTYFVENPFDQNCVIRYCSVIKSMAKEPRVFGWCSVIKKFTWYKIKDKCKHYAGIPTVLIGFI